MADRSWMARAACRGLDPGLFFTEGPVPAEVKAICDACPVVDACLAYAVEHRIGHGLWGGRSERARRRIQRDQQPVTTTRTPPRNHCRAGHEFTPDNTTWVTGRSGQTLARCVACRRAAKARYRARLRVVSRG